MTCVSPRSGMASSGTVRIDQTPVATATATRMKTRKRLRPENSMSALIMIGTLTRRWAVGGRRWANGGRRWANGGRWCGGRACCRGGRGRTHPRGGGLQPAFRVDEERAGRDHALSGCDALEHRHAIADALADRDGAWLDVAP